MNPPNNKNENRVSLPASDGNHFVLDSWIMNYFTQHEFFDEHQALALDPLKQWKFSTNTNVPCTPGQGNEISSKAMKTRYVCIIKFESTSGTIQIQTFQTMMPYHAYIYNMDVDSTITLMRPGVHENATSIIIDFV